MQAAHWYRRLGSSGAPQLQQVGVVDPVRKNEVTKKGPPELDLPVSGTPSFVTSFLRDERNPDFGTCCICGAPLADGCRYQCEACAEEGVRRDAERFGQGGQP